MIKTMCVEKIRDKKGTITNYILEYADGNLRQFESMDLKMHIKQGYIEVLNLQLTSNGILRNKKVNNRQIRKVTATRECFENWARRVISYTYELLDRNIKNFKDCTGKCEIADVIDINYKSDSDFVEFQTVSNVIYRVKSGDKISRLKDFLEVVNEYDDNRIVVTVTAGVKEDKQFISINLATHSWINCLSFEDTNEAIEGFKCVDYLTRVNIQNAVEEFIKNLRKIGLK